MKKSDIVPKLKYAAIFAALLMNGCQTLKESLKENFNEKLEFGETSTDNAQAVIDKDKLLPAANADEALSKARKAWQEGKIDLAQTYYVKAYGFAPKNTKILEEMADIYRRLNKLDLAETSYRLILEQDKTNLPIRERYGLLLMQLNKLPEAEQALQQVITTDKHRWKSYNGLGIIADIGGKHAEAGKFFEQAYALQPNNPELLNNYGFSLYMQGKLQEARELFLRALKIQPDFKKALYNFALVEARHARYPEALASFSKVLTLPEANNDTGYIAMMNGDLEAAEFYLNEATKLSPNFYQKAHENLDALNARKEY
jgi:Flp pilus assembly protein TadD